MQRFQSLILFLGISLEGNPNMGMAKIRGKQGFGDRNVAQAGVRQLVADQFLEFFPDAFGKAFMPMRVHDFQDTIRS